MRTIESNRQVETIDQAIEAMEDVFSVLAARAQWSGRVVSTADADDLAGVQFKALDWLRERLTGRDLEREAAEIDDVSELKAVGLRLMRALPLGEPAALIVQAHALRSERAVRENERLWSEIRACPVN